MLHLNPRYHLVVVAHEAAVVLLDEVEPLLLQGPEVVLLLPLVDGTRDLEAIVAAVHPALDAATARGVVEHLERDGIIESDR